MTYVEFYDKTSIENICSILTDIPERVVFVGEHKNKMEKSIRYYKKVFSKRGHEIEFLSKAVSKWDLEQVVQVLTEILNLYEDCVFGITGGDEIALLALGIIYERNREKKIQIHRVGIRNNRIYDCDKDGNTIYKKIPSLSIEENIRIYGGDIAYGTITEENTYLWNVTAEFSKDIEVIWDICKENVRKWNIQAGVFETIGKVGINDEAGLQISASMTAIENYYRNHTGSYRMDKGIVEKLCEAGLITVFHENETQVVISYKDLQVKKCLTKAGQSLEMKVFLTAKHLTDAEGKSIYNDVLNGVVIDWDGEFQEEEDPDTKNEIDVMLMHGMIPVFISCKNGLVTVEELYKLNTVAERFGGMYSKKVLIATSLSRLKDSEEYFKQRARDMNIRIVENIQDMDDHELAKNMSRLWEN